MSFLEKKYQIKLLQPTLSCLKVVTVLFSSILAICCQYSKIIEMIILDWVFYETGITRHISVCISEVLTKIMGRDLLMTERSSSQFDVFCFLLGYLNLHICLHLAWWYDLYLHFSQELHLSLGTASVHAWDMSFHVLEIIFLAYCIIGIVQIGIHPCFIIRTCFPCPVC